MHVRMSVRLDRTREGLHDEPLGHLRNHPETQRLVESARSVVDAQDTQAHRLAQFLGLVEDLADQASPDALISPSREEIDLDQPEVIVVLLDCEQTPPSASAVMIRWVCGW